MKSLIVLATFFILIAGRLAIAQATQPAAEPLPPELRPGEVRLLPIPNLHIPRRVVYLIDADGMARHALELVMDELGKSVISLKPIQFFDIVVVQQDGLVTFSENGPIAANPTNKRGVASFAEKIKTCDHGDIIPALDRAFAGKPNLIYILAHKSFPDNDAVAKKVASLNADRKVMVNTIAFDPPSDDKQLIEMLKKIADESHGDSRTITEESLKAAKAADSTTQPATP